MWTSAPPASGFARSRQLSATMCTRLGSERPVAGPAGWGGRWLRDAKRAPGRARAQSGLRSNPLPILSGALTMRGPRVLLALCGVALGLSFAEGVARLTGDW